MAGWVQTIYDVSFAGANVVIDGYRIVDFMDDQNPVDFQDTDVANAEWSLNGRMIRTVKPSGILMSVTVVPASPSDDKLMKILRHRFNNGGDVNLSVANQPINATITLAGSHAKSYNFSMGTCIAGPLGPSAQGSGKMGGNTFSFLFERVE